MSVSTTVSESGRGTKSEGEKTSIGARVKKFVRALALTTALGAISLTAVPDQAHAQRGGGFDRGGGGGFRGGGYRGGFGGYRGGFGGYRGGFYRGGFGYGFGYGFGGFGFGLLAGAAIASTYPYYGYPYYRYPYYGSPYYGYPYYRYPY